MKQTCFSHFSSLRLSPRRSAAAASLLFILPALAADLPPFNTELLRRAGKSVTAFWDELQAVNCIETVDQQKLTADGKSTFRQQTDFDYIAILQLTGNDLIVDESRTMVRAPDHENKLPLLITNGFSTFALIFHPFYQGAYEFSAPETVQVEGKPLFRIGFRHVRGARSPSVLKLRTRDYPVEWQGTAWIDPPTGAVVRVSAALMGSMEDVGLKALTADVHYASVEFKGEAGAHWLPSTAVIEVETPHQRWRNTHTFSKYRQFSVDVKSEGNAEMSATAARYIPAPAEVARKRRHRFWILLGGAAGIAVTIVLSVNGIGYYILPGAARVASPKHSALNPSGTIGNALGIVGAVLLMLMYLYPLRKKWKWLSKKGKTKNWLDYHILMGLVGPVLITFHSAFKLSGVAGAAYWSMIAVVASGIVGRYLYNRIPRRLDAVEMSVEEAGDLCASLAERIRAQNILTEEELRPLLALPSLDEVRAMPLAKALLVIISLDVRRAWNIRRLHSHVAGHAEVRSALSAIREQAALSKDALFLAKVQRMFRLWHVVHRPFSYSLAIMATLHILVVVFLGYF